ncbi:MAG: DUF885 domain-containing protein [Bacteroidetes bacterium]|nr:MAG: DUF885 domain-containing protein [Bacteroidota bacterium]MBL1144599.1 DUF885 domain-containing protein [Bacteroidota bacterium]NOG57394.1 DUF885 domain-containing protein [Bacteroidota bacterium]
MKKSLFFLSAVILFACNQKTIETKELTADEKFDNYKNQFVLDLWKENPVWASYEGFHDYDNQLPIPDQTRKEAEVNFWKNVQLSLDTFNLDDLNENNQIDYHILKDKIQSNLFYITEFKSDTWNPSSYNLGGAFYQIINYKEKALNDRLLAIYEKMENISDYYQTAKSNLEKPTQVHTALAIQQLKGSMGVFEKTIMDSLIVSTLNDSMKSLIEQRVNNSLVSISDFVSFLTNEVQPNLEKDAKSFRIGSELYAKKFKHDLQAGFEAAEIYRFALKEKQILHEKMYAVSQKLWSKYYPNENEPKDSLTLIRKTIEAVSQNHVHRDSFIVSIRRQIPELERFVQDNNLITLDPNKPLVVRETPEYMRGFAGASISAPGPYDKNANTYYNVTPLDAYTEEEAESYLREYNHYTLQILNIHEAVPGHYTQLDYSNQSPSIIKSIFGNGAMVEGWAVYTELMMLENGYGKGEPELDLMYYKWNLRTVCNTLLDYGIHVNNLSEEAAMDLLMNQAFQEKSEATGKWRRARLSQVQLCSYFTGYYEIRALREEVKALLGDQFDLKKFHEDFLSYGSAPVKYIRELLLKDIDKEKPLS